MLIYLHLQANSDQSGNPRRLYLVKEYVTYQAPSGEDLGYFSIVDAIDQGYQGPSALTSKYANAVNAGTFDISVSEYKRLLKEHAKK